MYEASSRLPVVIVGLGEIGQVFGRGFLRSGHPVVPVTRAGDPEEVNRIVPEPLVALVAVAEADLHQVLDLLPESWRSRVGLLQNELLPRDWEQHGLTDPNVAVVWFEKKAGRPVTVILPTPVWGPAAADIVAALDSIGIQSRIVTDDREAVFELVRKNLYILTANIAGIVAGGSVGRLWHDHRSLAEDVAADVLDIQEHLIGGHIDRSRLITGMVEAIEADPDHGATGRSAPARLARALRQARAADLAVPALRAVDARIDASTS